MGAKHITVELHPADNTVWRFDSFEDGPLNEWLATVIPRLGKDLSQLSHNATIWVWDHGGS